MTRAIILENESPAMEALAAMLEQYCPTVKLEGKAYTNAEAKKLIDKCSPDLIFMDIELDTGNSLELLTYYNSPQFDIIFTTAHEEYAIQAIKVSCLDYLIKPIDYRELQKAVVKHQQKLSINTFRERLHNMIHNLGSQHLTKVAIPTEKGFEFFDTMEIIMCQVERGYTYVHTTNQGQHLTSKQIGELETWLTATSFFRCHKSNLINLKHILEFHSAENQIVLTGNITVDLAAARREEFLSLIREGLLISPVSALRTNDLLTGEANHLTNHKIENFNLTERELEVLRLLAKGHNYSFMAEQLFISTETVKKHVANTFRKLNVKNKIEAMLKAKTLL